MDPKMSSEEAALVAQKGGVSQVKDGGYLSSSIYIHIYIDIYLYRYIYIDTYIYI